MNIIALSDVHLRSTNPIARKDNAIKTQFKKLRFIFDYARKNNCIILQAGDFLDKSRDWNLLVMLIHFFKKYKDVPFYCVLGQHDSYFYSETKGTTLGVLENMGLVWILHEVPLAKEDDVLIFGSSWGSDIPEPASSKSNNILVTHRPISDTQIYPGQEYTDYEVFLESYPKYDLIIVGDIHRSFYYESDGRYIVNTGPMLRAEANEYNMDHHTPHFWHFKFKGYRYSSLTISSQLIPIPHKPSYEVLSRSHIVEREDVDIESLSSIIRQGLPGESANKIIFENIFQNDSIRPKIKRHLMEIYENAKG